MTEGREKLKNDILEILTGGFTEKEIERKLRSFRNKIRRSKTMPTNELDALIEETKEERSQSPEAQQKDEFLSTFNSTIKSAINYGGKSLTYNMFKDDTFNSNRVTLKKNKLNKWSQVKASLENLKIQHSNFFVKGDDEKIDDIIDQIDGWISRGADVREELEVNLAPEELIRGVINIRITENRKKVYQYWKKISEHHDDVITAVENFKTSIAQSGMEDGLKEIASELPLPPNYILSLPAKRQNVWVVGKRLGDWVAYLFEALEQSRNAKVSGGLGTSKRIPKGWKDLTDASRQKRGSDRFTQYGPYPDSGEPSKETALVVRDSEEDVPAKSRVTDVKHSIRQPHHNLERKDLEKELEQFTELDPIYYNILLDAKNNFHVNDAFELADIEKRFNRWLKYSQENGLSDLETELKTKLAQLKREVFDNSRELEYHHPISNWVKTHYTQSDLNSSIMDIEDVTGDFFKGLSDLLFEFKGQEAVVMSPKYPEAGKDVGQEKGPMVSGPSFTSSKGKPTSTGLKVRREQAGIKPEERKNLEADVSQKWGVLKEALDKYYFGPLSKEYLMIDEELPRFKSDLTDARAYTLMSLTFSENPTFAKEKEMTEQLLDNLNYVALNNIKSQLKNEISEETRHNTEAYKKVLNELIEDFEDWGLDKKWAAEFAADQFARYLTARQKMKELNEHELAGWNAGELYDAWENRGGWSESIVYSIRKFLKGSRFNTLIREWELIGMKKQAEQFRKLKDGILELTSPDVINNIPTFAKALLDAMMQ